MHMAVIVLEQWAKGLHLNSKKGILKCTNSM